MKITRIILSSNNDPTYLQYWPLVVGAWKRLTGITPDVALVGVDPSDINQHRFVPIESMPSANQAKVSRLLLASEFPEEWCMLSDIDMLPLGRQMIDAIEPTLSQGDWISCYGSDAFQHVDLTKNLAHGSIPICYLAAKGRTFGKLFGSDADFSLVQKWTDWRANPFAVDFSDEAMIRHLLGRKQIQVCGIKRGWPNGVANGRIDRGSWYIPWDRLAKGDMIDAHLPRVVQPYHQLNELINPAMNPNYA